MQILDVFPSVLRQLRSTQVILMMMLLGAAGFGGFAAYKVLSGSPPVNTEIGHIVAILVSGFSVVSVVLFFVFGLTAKKDARKAATGATSEEARQWAVARVLTSSSIQRGVLSEASGLLGAIGTYATGNLVFLAALVVPFVLIGSMMQVRPRFEALYAYATGSEGR